MTTYYQGILGFIIFVLDIWAMVHVIGSQRSAVNKLVWILVILLLPILGFLLWLFFGPRAAKP